jgi:hypothetical protein
MQIDNTWAENFRPATESLNAEEDEPGREDTEKALFAVAPVLRGLTGVS